MHILLLKFHELYRSKIFQKCIKIEREREIEIEREREKELHLKPP